MSFRTSAIALAMVIVFVLFGLPRAAGQAEPDAPAVPTDQPAEVEAAAPEVVPPQAPAERPEPAEGELAPEEERTMGEAFLLKLREGGLTMVFLFLVSVAGVGYAIERAVNLRLSAIAPEGLAEEANKLWRMGEFEEIERLPDRKDSTLARALAVVARHRHSNMADVSMMAGDVASRDLRRHLQRAYGLAVVATVSPLLGLLGTVIGMIGAFDKVAAAGALGDASLLGGDISKALITTGAGLTIAVPSLILYHYFKNRTNQYALVVEEELGELIGTWYGAEADVEQTEDSEEDDES